MTSDLMRRTPDDEMATDAAYTAYFGSSRWVCDVPDDGIFGVVSSPSAIAAPGSICQAWHYAVWQAVSRIDRDGLPCRMYRVMKDDSGADRARVLEPDEVDYFSRRYHSLSTEPVSEVEQS